MEQISFDVKSARGTATIARDLAAEIIKTRPGRGAVVVGLNGELGSGKTVFVKGFMRALGVRRRVISPTFILMRNFKLKGHYTRAYHVDAYRTDDKSLSRLGFKRVLGDPKNIVLIEWAGRARRLLPKDTIVINFEHGIKQNERRLTFNRR